MMTRFIVMVIAVFLLAGCGKKSENLFPSTVTQPAAESTSVSQATASSTAMTNLISPARGDIQPLLDQLTLSVRQYCLATHLVPSSLSVVVVAGYLAGVPTAPAGKKFAVDPKKIQVILIKE